MLLLASAAVMAAAQDPSLGRRALSFLAGQGKSPDAEVRAAAAAAWGDIGNKAALPLLKAALKDSDDSVKIEAAVSLHKLGDPEGAGALEAIVTRSSATAKGKLSPAEELKQRARDKTRAQAALKLSEMGSVRVVELLEKTLKSDRSGAVRDAAAVALCRLGLDEEGSFADRFLNALGDDDEYTRAEAVKSLGMTKAPVAFEALKDAAADASPDVRAEAMKALAGFPSPETRALLEMGLLDEQPRVRLRALDALAELKDQAAADALRGQLKPETDKAQQLVAAKGLALLGERVDLTLAKRQLDSPDLDARALALETIAASDAPELFALLSRVLDDESAPRLQTRAAMHIVLRMGMSAKASPNGAQPGDATASPKAPSTPVPSKPTAAPMPMRPNAAPDGTQGQGAPAPKPAPGGKEPPKGLPGLGGGRP